MRPGQGRFAAALRLGWTGATASPHTRHCTDARHSGPVAAPAGRTAMHGQRPGARARPLEACPHTHVIGVARHDACYRPGKVIMPPASARRKFATGAGTLEPPGGTPRNARVAGHREFGCARFSVWHELGQLRGLGAGRGHVCGRHLICAHTARRTQLWRMHGLRHRGSSAGACAAAAATCVCSQSVQVVAHTLQRWRRRRLQC